MGNSQLLWETWLLAKQWQTRPSVLLAISDEITAYYLDRAVTHFGQNLEADLEEAGAGLKDEKMIQHKRQLILDRWLGVTDVATTAGRFRDPAAMSKG